LQILVKQLAIMSLYFEERTPLEYMGYSSRPLAEIVELIRRVVRWRIGEGRFT
jgi:hypothetical protein